MNTLDTEAVTYHETFCAFRRAGFTRWEALALIANIIIASGRASETGEEEA